jgi:protein-disulfide isomerase
LGGIFVNRAIIAAVAVVALLVSAYVLTRGTHSASADRGAEASEAAAPVSVPPADPAPATSTTSSSSTPANASASSSAETRPTTPAASASKPLLVPQALAGIPDLDPHEAVGSKSAPIVMEVFSDYQCPRAKFYTRPPTAC